MVASLKLAITGATGFVGGRLLELAISEGHEVSALTRRPQAERAGVTWVSGALDQPAGLDQLVKGADAVIHVAGVINAPDQAGFVRLTLRSNSRHTSHYTTPPRYQAYHKFQTSLDLVYRQVELFLNYTKLLYQVRPP